MKHTYPSALVLLAVVLPIPVLATFITIGLYIILAEYFTSPDWLNWVALMLGLSATIVIWLVSALFFRSSTTAKNVNELCYDSIMQELKRLEMNFQSIEVNALEVTIEPDEVVEAAETTPAVKAAGTDEANVAIKPTQVKCYSGALQKAKVALFGEQRDENIERLLQVNGMQWVKASGYINIWKRLQTADVEMIALLPVEIVLGDADYDQLRLEGSSIPNNQYWIDVITKAKATLETLEQQNIAHPGGKAPEPLSANDEQKLLGQAMLDLLKFDLTSPTLPLDDTNIPKSFGAAFFALIQRAVSPPPQAMENQARAELRRARIAINSYITNRWTELIQFRDQLFGVAFVTSILVYALSVIAIIGKAPASSFIAAFAFYFVGAIVGLYMCLTSKPRVRSRLGDQSGHPRSESLSINRHFSGAYGLALARILVAPVFSGLAALIGVGLATILSIFLLTMAPGPSNTATSTPSPTAIVAVSTPTVVPIVPQGERSVSNFPSLDQVYSLPNNVQGGITFAVIFGFLSSLVIGSMQKEATALRSQIRSTDPGEKNSA